MPSRPIQILEFFDRTVMTIGQGDMRRLREKRLAIFNRRGDQSKCVVPAL